MSVSDPPAVLTVSELTRQIDGVLSTTFDEVWVRGEVGRATYASSGHVYLSLKDADAVLRCNIWLVRGSERDLLVDSGLGVISLKEAVDHLFLERELGVVEGFVAEAGKRLVDHRVLGTPPRRRSTASAPYRRC